MKPFLIAVALLALGAASVACDKPVPSHPGPLGLETIPDDEPESIRKTVAVVEQIIRNLYPDGVRPARRDAHAKAHGCVKAAFTVPELPDDLRVGVFEKPRTFDAWIRYSNGNPTPQADKIGDGRGMAIKLMGVEGDKLLADERNAKTQDFLMINNPVFFIDTAANYYTFEKDSEQGNARAYFIGISNPLHWHLRGAEIVLQISRKKVVNPLEIRYWSMAPYLLGTRAIKFSAKPCEIHEGMYKATDSDNFLADNMQLNLDQGEGCFEFMVQVQKGAKSMPIEDPTVEWKQAESPFIKVADIRIPSQQFRSDEQMTFCENLSYTPWHALPEHRPLGGINRLRKAVYEAISRLRHELNMAPRKEPTAGPDFLPQ